MAPIVSAPPFDVMETEEARRMADGNDASFLHVSPVLKKAVVVLLVVGF